MISSESIIPINNGFVSVDRLEVNQSIHGKKGLTRLTLVHTHKHYGTIVETTHFSIVVSSGQLFITPKGNKKTSELKVGELILTSDDWKPITKIESPQQIYEFYHLVTDDGTYRANGFCLTNK